MLTLDISARRRTPWPMASRSWLLVAMAGVVGVGGVEVAPK